MVFNLGKLSREKVERIGRIRKEMFEYFGILIIVISVIVKKWFVSNNPSRIIIHGISTIY